MSLLEFSSSFIYLEPNHNRSYLLTLLMCSRSRPKSCPMSKLLAMAVVEAECEDGSVITQSNTLVQKQIFEKLEEMHGYQQVDTCPDPQRT